MKDIAKVLNVHVSAELWQQLRQLMQKQDRSLANIARIALRDYIQKAKSLENLQAVKK